MILNLLSALLLISSSAASIPSYNPSVVYPTSISFMGGSYEGYAGYVREDRIVVDPDDVSSTGFELGYGYLLTGADIAIDQSGGVSLVAAYFNKYQFNNFKDYDFHLSYAFEFFTPATNTYIVTQWNYKFDISVNNVYLTGNDYTQTSDYNFRYQNTASTSTGGGPYYAYLPSDGSFVTFVEGLAAQYCSVFIVSDTNYQRGYDDGKQVGISIGEAAGYERGVADAGSPIANVARLFAAVVGIPISVLNAMNDFTLFGIPVISVTITIFMAAVLIWLVKRFI